LSQLWPSPQQFVSPQRVVPDGQAAWQRSLTHSWSLEQQAPPQRVVPAGHEFWQKPLSPQICPGWQQRPGRQQNSCKNWCCAQQAQPADSLPQQKCWAGQ
jgi:hypothetical protein